jgi:dCTP deaminase
MLHSVKFHVLSDAAAGEADGFDNAPVKPGRSLLSRSAILSHIRRGNIIIIPCDEEDIRTTSVDVRLGPWYFRQQANKEGRRFVNPFSKADIDRYWGTAQFARHADLWMADNGPLENIRPEDYIIALGPGETILAHIREFIGGRNCVTTEMRARSTMGRVGITVCKCAGWGDLGYVNRWTMEMTNHGDLAIVMVVGMRVAQIPFYEVDPLAIRMSYAKSGGKYQTSDDLDEIVRSWKPEAMLPQMFKDREIRTGFPGLEECDVELAKQRGILPVRD